jgi:hypothetical protein
LAVLVYRLRELDCHPQSHRDWFLSFADDLFSDLPKDVKCGRMTIEEIASGLGK